MSKGALKQVLAAGVLLSAMAGLSACASDDQAEVDKAAREACESRRGEGEQVYDSCIAQMEQSIYDARAYRHEPPHPAAKPKNHNG